MRIIKKGLVLLSVAHVPLIFWAYAMCTIVLLINRLLSKVLYGLSPFELLYDKVFSYNELKAFDFQCFTYMCAYNKHKFESRALECVF